MEPNPQDSAGMKHPSQKRENAITGIVGVVGGGALFVAIMVWYFWMVAQPAPPLPGTPIGAKSGSGTAAMPASRDDENVRRK